MLKKLVLGVCLVAVLALFASGATATTPTRGIAVWIVGTEGEVGYSLTVTVNISQTVLALPSGTPQPSPYQGKCYITLSWDETMLTLENEARPPVTYGAYVISHNERALPTFTFWPLAAGTSYIDVTKIICTDYQDGSAIPTNYAGGARIVVQPAPVPIPMDTPIPIPTAAWVPPVAVTTSVIITAPPTGSGGYLP